MRPQHITAENADQCVGAGRAPDASMRPQHITAENLDLPDGTGGGAAALQ